LEENIAIHGEIAKELHNWDITFEIILPDNVKKIAQGDFLLYENIII